MAKDWDLNDRHKVRYFATDELEKVLKRIRSFVKNDRIEVMSVSLDMEYSTEDAAIYWNAVVVYIGTVTEDNNVEA